jgi:hypothetical protein
MGKRKVTILEPVAIAVAEVAFFIESKGMPQTAKKFVREAFPVFRTFKKYSLKPLLALVRVFEMGVAGLFLEMFLRKLKNRSGSISVQIISKSNGKYKVIKTIGSGISEQEIQKLWLLGKQELERLKSQSSLFVSENDILVERVFDSLKNASIRTVGPEIIFGKIYDHIGFGAIREALLRHLVIARLAFPLSKLKTIEYVYRYQGVLLDIDAIYRFLDKLNNKLKEQVEQIAFTHTQKVLGGNISIVFYDMTTLYFEASDEDDLRKTGFSKDGKHQNPQIYLGLLVGLGGYAIGYDIFEGSIYEGHTLIPFLEKITARFHLDKPVVVADAGLLSNDNIRALEQRGYEYIIGARLKNEPEKIKQQILQKQLANGEAMKIKKTGNTRLIITYAANRTGLLKTNTIESGACTAWKGKSKPANSLRPASIIRATTNI